MKTWLQQVEEFEATLLLLGGEAADEERWDDWAGKGPPDEESDMWKCNRKVDFDNLVVSLLYDENGGHKVLLERYVNFVYVDSGVRIVEDVGFTAVLEEIAGILQNGVKND